LPLNEKDNLNSSKKIEERRSFSPNKMMFYTPSHKHSDKSNRDQSLNANKIISSLKEANKKRIAAPLTNNTQKRYENKPFPK
jgi:hypothetical protein